MLRFKFALGLLVLALVAPSSAAAAGPTTTVVREAQIGATPTSTSSRSLEPIVATHPKNPSIIAAVYPTGVSPIITVVRISHDAGRTWRSTPTRPFRGGRHPAIAWGPGPNGARLYYANMTGSSAGVYLATSWSDNEGKTWSTPRLERSTTPWVGGFPDITVDNNPASPNYGVVYVAYNWPASKTRGPGLHVIASANFGRTWTGTEIAVAPRPSGYGDTWRINYRVRTAANGSVYVSFFQADMRYWNYNNIFAKGGTSNVGRLGFSVARFEFDRSAKVFTKHPSVSAAKIPETAWNMGGWPAGTGGGLVTDPQWSTGLDVDPLTGRVYMAIGADGGIRVYRSDDRGKTWTHKKLPAAPDVAGRRQWSAKPNLVIGDGFVMITLHTLDRVSSGPTVGNAYSVSYDNGATWSTPRPINKSRWRAYNLSGVSNGSGLRDRAAVTADGRHVFFAYGDGRLASGSRRGQSVVFGALIAVNIPDPEPVVEPVPDPVP